MAHPAEKEEPLERVRQRDSPLDYRGNPMYETEERWPAMWQNLDNLRPKAL